MFKIKNLEANSNVKVIQEKGSFKVIEHQSDKSVNYDNAQSEFFASQMNVKRRQLICDLSKSDATLQAGAMQWMVGDVNMTTGVKGAGDFIGKIFKGAVSGEGPIKPEYTGTGRVTLEPTYKHIILLEAGQWNGGLVIEDGLFLASESSLKHEIVARNTFSSAVLGGEGLFNMRLTGNGVVALESDTPLDELVEIELDNDVVKIDGSMAVAWSSSLRFTVERAGKGLIGSAASGEGLVNVYQGTGKILIAPVIGPFNDLLKDPKGNK